MRSSKIVLDHAFLALSDWWPSHRRRGAIVSVCLYVGLGSLPGQVAYGAARAELHHTVAWSRSETLVRASAPPGSSARAFRVGAAEPTFAHDVVLGRVLQQDELA